MLMTSVSVRILHKNCFVDFSRTHVIVRPLRRQQRSLRYRIQKLLIRLSLLGNLLHKLFSRDEPLFNQDLRQCVSLREAGDEKFLPT
jgi:hypothetical protein